MQSDIGSCAALQRRHAYREKAILVHVLRGMCQTFGNSANVGSCKRVRISRVKFTIDGFLFEETGVGRKQERRDLELHLGLHVH